MRTIAIITARGGSKRIPQKNIREFCGKPIIAYSIEAAVTSGIFDEIMVSTDSEEIAKISRKYGAKVPFLRSKKTASDFATTRDVLSEVLGEYSKRGVDFDEMVCIYPTAPFLTSNILIDALKLMRKEKGALVVPVVKFSYPPQRAYVIKNGKLEFKWKEYRNARSQDLEPYYHDAGQFYCYDIDEYLKVDGIITQNIIPYELSELNVQDIDNEEDWKMAEVKWKLMERDSRL